MSLPEFAAFLKAQRLSQKTIRNYASDVSQFLNWINWSRRRHAERLGSNHFTDYLNHLQAKNTPLTTLARHLSALRQFARFLNLDINLANPPLPFIPTILKNFRAHLVKNRYKHKTVANYLSDVRHYLTWADAQMHSAGASEQERKRTPPDLDRVGPEHLQSLRQAQSNI